MATDVRKEAEKSLLEIAVESRKRRIKAICDAYKVNEFWGQDMSMDEIIYFERKIATGRL